MSDQQNPFSTALIRTFEMMVGLQPKPRNPYLKKDDIPTPGDISGVIGFAGENIMGSVALKFPEKLLLHIHNQLTGDKLTEITREVLDTAAELSNIVAGGGKSLFAERNQSFDITIPSVIVGKDHSISYQDDSKIVVLPFKIDQYVMFMELMVKRNCVT